MVLVLLVWVGGDVLDLVSRVSDESDGMDIVSVVFDETNLFYSASPLCDE